MNILQNLVKQFADDNGYSFEMLDNGYGGFLQIDAIRVRLILQPAGNMLVVQTGVGILPTENREELALRLLASNDLLHETHGMTLAVNRDAEVITLQATWSIDALSQEGFSNLIQHVVTETVRWIEILSDPHQDASASNGVNPSEEAGKINSWVKL